MPRKKADHTSTKSVRKTVAARMAHASADSVTGAAQAELELCAYHIYLSEGCPEGRHLEHWLAAESQLGSRAAG